jgi:hypothetical protein
MQNALALRADDRHRISVNRIDDIFADMCTLPDDNGFAACRAGKDRFLAWFKSGSHAKPG